MMFGATGELTRRQGSAAASDALCHGKEKNHPAERTLIEPQSQEAAWLFDCFPGSAHCRTPPEV